MNKEVAAVILAAGGGRRIGGPKLKLEIGGQTFLALIAGNLRLAGIGDIVAVVRPEDRAWAEGLGIGLALECNPHPGQGMISSLHLGILRLPHGLGVMVAPVDHPLVRAGTYAALAACYRPNPHSLVKPVYRGQAGHPVVIPAPLAARVPRADIPGGLQRLVTESGIGWIALEVDDPGVCQNINTLADLAAISEKEP